ncbi:hypothetical protein PV04_04322 [Phialophora macrospora]|uniref:Myocyte-specific enhancer factor 2d n=1 Tax=Phialophora macrospora TaxID=1851006 RepID=A0A0D2G8Y0_9EURO|nr:hypothetical protein PV04_04322 [Phialophora macrospora]
MPPSLPGYYFDAEKNRYFRIQANQDAPPGSKYSRQAVKAEKVIKKDQQRIERNRRAKLATTVTRSKFLQHPLLSFDRRLGDLRRNGRTRIVEYYAASLQAGEAIGPGDEGQSFEADDGPSIRPRSGHFAVDHGSGTVFGDFSKRIRCIQPTGTMYALCRDGNGFDEQRYPAEDGRWRSTRHPESTGPLYPLEHRHWVQSTSGVQLVASIGSGIVAWVESRSRTSRLRVGTPRPSRLSGRYQVEESEFDNRIVDLAVQPAGGGGCPPTNYTIALATESSAWIMNLSDFWLGRAQYLLNQDARIKDLMKIRFLDSNVLMCGTRSGKVLLLDLREPPLSRTRVASTRIQHSSAITNLRALADGSSVLLAGLASTSVYDLRFTPPPGMKWHIPHLDTHSPAVLSFDIPVTRRQKQYDLGWAYDPELNIVVSASTDYVKNHRVGIWNASTGRMVPSPLNEFVFDRPVKCAEIARVRDGPKSILLSGPFAGSIMEWSAQQLDQESEQIKPRKIERGSSEERDEERDEESDQE